MAESLKTRAPSPAALRDAVERMIAAPAFARQGRATQLLRYLLEESLAGRAAGIKESVIALDVFRRSEYDPKVDSLVRVEIAKLRLCIERYYEAEGSDDPIRIAIPKRSYAPVVAERVPEAPIALPPPARPGRSTFLALFVSAALVALLAGSWMMQPPTGLSGPPSLAVLPLTDLTSDRSLQTFCEGLTDQLTTALAAGDYLRVASRASAAQFKDASRDARRIGRELDVHALLEGSVSSEGPLLRVTLRLINASDGFHLWTQTFEAGRSDAGEAQRTLAREVETVFRFYLTGATRGLTRPGTRNRDAWHYYLRAAKMATSGEPERAAEFYRAATASDPGYALAWAGLSQSLVTMADWGMGSRDTLSRAVEAAYRATTLDAQPPAVQQALASVKVFVERDWAGAETALQNAIRADPTDVNLRYDYARLVLTPQGRFEEAIKTLRAALAIHPRGNHLMNALAYTLIRSGRQAEALPLVERSLKVNQTAPAAHVLRGMIANALDGPGVAIAWFRRAVALHPSHWTRTQLGVALARSGQASEAERLLTGTDDAYSIAVLQCVLGRNARAIKALEQAYAEHSPSIPWVAVDPDLATLRNEPAFDALLDRMNLSVRQHSLHTRLRL